MSSWIILSQLSVSLLIFINQLNDDSWVVIFESDSEWSLELFQFLVNQMCKKL